MKILKKIILPIYSIIFLFALFIPNTSHALIKLQDPIKNAFGSSKVHTTDDAINMVLSILFYLGAISVFIYGAIGGIMYFFAVGNQDQAKKAQAMIYYAAIGFVMLVSAYALAEWAINYVLS
jgi:hypothetical protein